VSQASPDASASTSSLSLDTPINRATVCMLSTQELERELDGIRERRLALRLKVEALAKIKGDKADLTSFLKFEKLLKKTQDDLKGLDTRHATIEQAVNKLRALVIEMGE
jgi:hypothetical protein